MEVSTPPKKKRLRLFGSRPHPPAEAAPAVMTKEEDARSTAASDMTSSFEAIAAAAIGLAPEPRGAVIAAATQTDPVEVPEMADASVSTEMPSPTEAEEILAKRGEEYCVMLR